MSARYLLPIHAIGDIGFSIDIDDNSEMTHEPKTNRASKYTYRGMSSLKSLESLEMIDLANACFILTESDSRDYMYIR